MPIRKKRSGARRRRQPAWARVDIDTLLQVRLCDLRVSIKGMQLEDRIAQVQDELHGRGLRFRPHFWVSSDWFTPDGVPGCAIPFYLTHPRLVRLERTMMLEAEGSSQRECLKILRHEVGHALDNAYRLSHRRDWQKHFGSSTKRYPSTYLPRAGSRKYVQHLHSWYAQAHPTEDFAETFAVWLSRGSRWRRRYEGWPALKKLEYVDELMKSMAGKRPRVTNRRIVDPLSKIRMTLGDYYTKKQKMYGEDYPDFYDRDLRKLFSDLPEHRKNQTAASFLRRIRPEVRRQVSHWTGESQYTLDQVLEEIIDRCSDLNLRVTGDRRKIRTNLAIILTLHTMNYVHSAPRRVAL